MEPGGHISRPGQGGGGEGDRHQKAPPDRPARIAFLDDTATLGLTIGTGAAPLIAGFVQGDMISAIGVTATGVAYAATGDDVGTLSFLDGTSTVASLTLSGNSYNFTVNVILTTDLLGGRFTATTAGGK